MKTQQSGFTLIELVMVIVILGILAAVAMPKYTDLKTDAGLAGAQGVAGAITSASSINYGVRSAKATNGVATATLTCAAAAAALLVEGALPNGYTTAGNVGAVGVTSTCVITNTASAQVANAYIIGI